MSSAATARAVERTRRGERILELAAVVILAMATLGSAWCAYEATRWNSEETSLAQQATNEQVEASRLFGLATQAVSYDSTLVAQYAEAVSAGNDGLKEFYRTTLIRPGFLPVLDRWEAQLASGAAPTNLLEDDEYLSAQLGGYQAAQARGQAATSASKEAGEKADEYVLLTLVFASALFFAGVTSSFRMRTARLLLLVSAVVLIGYAASQLATLPVT